MNDALNKVMEIRFDAEGKLETRFDELAGFAAKLKHVIFHAHGFNQDTQSARVLSGDYFDKFQSVLAKYHSSSADIGYCLVLWPSAGQSTEFGRIATRAERVGEQGLADVVNRLKKQIPSLFIHLSGHSLGARLAAFTLKRLKTRVNSVFLIQGALPAWSFAYDLLGPNQRGSATKQFAKQFGAHNELQGALADARANATFIGATFAARDEMMHAYVSASEAAELVYTLAPFGLVLDAKPESILMVALPPQQTLLDGVPLGMVGMRTGPFEHLQVGLQAVETGRPYPRLGVSLTSFDFSRLLRNHDDFRREEVAWAHLKVARFL